MRTTRSALTVERCRTREHQEAAIAALRFKTEMLWAQLDAIERGDSQNPIPSAPGHDPSPPRHRRTAAV